MALTKARNRMIEGAQINVLDYGAVGDGTTDDTVAVQAAITASNGTPVVFNSGKTFLCDTLTVSSDDHLIINGTIKASLTVTDTPLITGANVSNVIIEGTGHLEGQYNISTGGYQGRSATEPTTRTDSSALQVGDTFYDTSVGQFKQYSGSAWAIITAYRAGIKLDKSVDCRVENLTIENFILTAEPGNWGAGVWFEGDPDGTLATDSLRNVCINVKANYNIGCGIAVRANVGSSTERCFTKGNVWGSGIASTRGLQFSSINDTLESNEFTNLTVNCEESQIFYPTSRLSGYAGINIGHDNADGSDNSNASRTLMVGGVSENNNFEGVSSAGSDDVTIIGTLISGNGENVAFPESRYGLRVISDGNRLHLIGLKITGSFNAGIYLGSGVGHRIESCKIYANKGVGLFADVPDIHVSDCEIYDNNADGITQRAGVQLREGNSVITDTKIYDTKSRAKTTHIATAGQTDFNYNFKITDAGSIRVERDGYIIQPSTYTVRGGSGDDGVGTLSGYVEITGYTVTEGQEFVISGTPDSMITRTVATSGQDVFPYDFTPEATSDLKVIRITSADPNGRLLALTTDYTVSANAVGGTISLTSAFSFTLSSGTPLVNTSYTVNGSTYLVTSINGSVITTTRTAGVNAPPSSGTLSGTPNLAFSSFIDGADAGDIIRVGVATQNWGVLAQGGSHRIEGCTVHGHLNAPLARVGGGLINETYLYVGNDIMSGTFYLNLNQNTTVVANDNAVNAKRILLIPRFFDSQNRGTYVNTVEAGVGFTVSHSSGSVEPYNYIIM